MDHSRREFPGDYKALSNRKLVPIHPLIGGGEAAECNAILGSTEIKEVSSVVCLIKL